MKENSNLFIEEEKGSFVPSSFFILYLLFFYSSLVYMLIWSIQNNNLAVLGVGLIAFVMSVLSIIFSKGKIFYSTGGFTLNSFNFILGFGFWFILLFLSKGNFSFLQNTLYSSVSTTIPRFYDFIFNVFVIPTAEELFFVVAIPSAIIMIFKPLFKSQEENSFLRFLPFILTIVIAGLSFSLFHIGRDYSFLFSAFLFRTIMILFVVGDEVYNFIGVLRFLPAFSIGSHIANNWFYYGFLEGFKLLFEGGIGGILILSFLSLIFLFGVQFVFDKLKHKI